MAPSFPTQIPGFRMAGHSKFKNIMHRKGRADAARSKLFSKLSREITVAAKSGPARPGHEPAPAPGGEQRQGRKPAQGRHRARHQEGVRRRRRDHEEIRYEGFGPGGVGIIVEALTDNRNRAGSNVRSAFTKNGGNLGETGSVSFMWDRVGQIVYAAEAGSEDEVMEAAIEAGARSRRRGSPTRTGPHHLHRLRGPLRGGRGPVKALGDAKSTALAWRPKALTPVTGDAVGTLMKLIDALEDEDDVQNVYSNDDISAEDAAKYGG